MSVLAPLVIFRGSDLHYSIMYFEASLPAVAMVYGKSGVG